VVEFKAQNSDDFPPRITVTSALPYVNGVKHLGNIVGSILPADIFHRFLDLFGVDNIYICGTDDHGTAVEIAAAEENLEPHEYARKYKKIQEEIYRRWNFDFTLFGNTSSKTNHDITQSIFLAARRNGYIVKKEIIMPYCEDCKRFLPDRYIIGTCPQCGYESARGDQCEQCSTVLDPIDLKDARCNVCGKSNISFKSEKHLFLDYALLSSKLKAWIEKNEHWPHNTKTLALGWIKEGLKPRCITRNLKWGIPVPLEGYENLVLYVWFDAPIGYISITKDAWKEGRIKAWKEYWTNSDIYHFLGKDNIPFHTIFWPGTLIAAKDTELNGEKINFVLPKEVIGYEYLNWEGEKFSTSKGIGLFSDETLDLFPADYWRFYLSYILPENKDANFDWEDFRRRINKELIANYGNLFYRVTYFIKENFDGAVPQGQIDKDAREIYSKLEETTKKIEHYVRDVKLRSALREAFRFASIVNKYFQDKKPWEKKNVYDTGNTLYTCANLLRSISIMLYPYIPATVETALQCLGVDKSGINWHDIAEEKIKPGQKIEARILFKKIEDKELQKAKQYISKYAKTRAASESSGIEKGSATEKLSKQGRQDSDLIDRISMVNGMIPFAEFQKLDLVVGTITSVSDHPNADKLYVLEVDLGNETRTLVAGLRDLYEKDDLRGKQIIVLTNLEPRELRGIKSHGMLLAADDGTLVSPVHKVPNGSKIR
jgi:methionyl-tRNA synthetase